ncbi:conjugal transfer protein TraG (plasmid) [Bacillus methanolicus]|uniref:type IV secretory system conjugative DNA transfer family protein n=1 Tax=Bacillus methanolicus TaxID=1471 RepID=UPI00238019C0|nr:type IV secretory system conjugative DNA transfer family protein [Bacillus methanolicus]MDE3841000.1 conjugal transfer protein TraG [Bacillus methanolicus]
MKDKLLPKLPVISMSLLAIVSLFLTLRSTFNYFFLMSGQFLGAIPSFILFGDSTQPGFFGFLFAALWLIVGWLVSTKFKRYQTPFWRRLWFWNMFLGITFHYLWLISAPVYNTLLPYLGERINMMEVNNIWHAIAVGDTNTLLLTIMFIPTAVTLMLLLWLSGQYSQYSAELKEAFNEFEFSNVLLQKWFKLETTVQWPDIVLGPESDTKELLIQPGKDRTLNNIIIGSIGTGKTAALVLPILNQDLHWMTRFINDYPEIYIREDYHTEEVKGKYLNGISVIEPSNDLCQKAFQLVKAHGIPEESVFYIDPTNPNTPSINPMQGPVDKVAEAFAMVIEGLAEGGNSNFFFQQSERNHLKHYIYLLKLHDPEQEVTFDMLLKMYDNPQLVRRMHLKLKETIPDNIDFIEDRDERNHWAIVKQIDEWFDMNLLPQMERAGGAMLPVMIKHGEYRNEPAYYDAKAEYVQGLRNILNDIGANPLIRRVLFGKSNFDFDKHLEMGGVLLVNTAKGELGGLSNILGKLILLSLQNAVFRRSPNVSTFHHILVDEFPDYIYHPFREFPAQSRKYKAIVTVVAQTVTQLADKYGETYMHTLLGTLRHKMVYGDIPDFDAQLFSKIFGEKERFEESLSEQAVSPLQEQPSLRVGSSYQKTKEAILSPADIIYQKPFQCAVKIVANNRPIPVKQIDANFVPKEEFKKAVVQVDKEAAELWLANRNQIVSEPFLIEEGIEEVEEPTGTNELPSTEEQSKTHQEREQLIGYPVAEQPVDYYFEEEDVGEIVQDEPNIPQSISIEEENQSIPLVEDQSKNTIENKFIQGSPKPGNELEPFSFSSVLGNKTSIQQTDVKPEQSELGEEQLQFADEILKEVKKVPASKEVASAKFYSDYEE